MGEKGFTLFEILIAMVVIVLTVTVSLGGMLGVLRFSEKMNQRTDAIARFEEILFKLEIGEYDEDEIRLHSGGASDNPGDIHFDDNSPLHGFYFRPQSGRENKG